MASILTSSSANPPHTLLATVGGQPEYRFSVDQYHRMIDAGVLTRAHHVQLIEGLVIDFDCMDESRPHGETYRFSVDQYHRMIEAGVLTRDDRVQLIEGKVVMMNPIGPTHSSVVQCILGELQPMFSTRWHVRVQQPLSLSHSEPEPDLAIVRGVPRDYFDRHPSVSDAAIVIEVAHSSANLDRGEKLSLYAAAGIAEYWIVDLGSRQIEIHREPQPDAAGKSLSQSVVTIPANGRAPVMLDGRMVGDFLVADVLPNA